MTRKYTNKLLDLINQGVLDKNELIVNLLIWMSEDDVEKFYKMYEYDSSTAEQQDQDD